MEDEKNVECVKKQHHWIIFDFVINVFLTLCHLYIFEENLDKLQKSEVEKMSHFRDNKDRKIKQTIK